MVMCLSAGIIADRSIKCSSGGAHLARKSSSQAQIRLYCYRLRKRNSGVSCLAGLSKYNLLAISWRLEMLRQSILECAHSPFSPDCSPQISCPADWFEFFVEQAPSDTEEAQQNFHDSPKHKAASLALRSNYYKPKQSRRKSAIGLVEGILSLMEIHQQLQFRDEPIA